MNYAQIMNGAVFGVFFFAEPPEFAANIHLVALPEGSPVKVGWLHLGGDVFTAPPAPTLPDYGTRMTSTALSRRLGLVAEIAIEEAAVTDATVRVLVRRMNQAEYLDQTDPEFAYGLNVLVAKQLLTAALVESVLTDPVQQIEVPG